MELIPKKVKDCDVLYYESYSLDEQQLLNKLENLFNNWIEELKKNEIDGFLFRDYKSTDLCFDGFYPNYFSQEPKILFIGKEALGLSGNNYLSTLFHAYKNNDVDGKSLDQAKFHRLIIYVAYGILHSIRNYHDLPYASDLINNLGSKDLSYAFMNISKFSNDSGNYQADNELIEKFVEISTKSPETNFIYKQIELLNPDLIITMNISNYFARIGNISAMEYNGGNEIKPYTLKINNKDVLLIDSYHFSYFAMKDESFYKSICDFYHNIKK